MSVLIRFLIETITVGLVHDQHVKTCASAILYPAMHFMNKSNQTLTCHKQITPGVFIFCFCELKTECSLWEEVSLLVQTTINISSAAKCCCSKGTISSLCNFLYIVSSIVFTLTKKERRWTRQLNPFRDENRDPKAFWEVGVNETYFLSQIDCTALKFIS